jgi:hypothetical protein
MPAAARRLLALMAVGAMADMELSCQIFDATIVCDADKSRIARGEIRTCSG